MKERLQTQSCLRLLNALEGNVFPVLMHAHIHVRGFPVLNSKLTDHWRAREQRQLSDQKWPRSIRKWASRFFRCQKEPASQPRVQLPPLAP